MPNWEKIRIEWETTSITLKALAEKYNVKLGTLKSRKSREQWYKSANKKDATKHKKDATKHKKDATVTNKVTTNVPKRKRSGNPNPKNQFTKRNTAAVTHGFFRKYFPEETLNIMEEIQERSPLDIIWDQITIQYTAIIRAQRIMFVKDKDEIIKKVKKEKEFSSESGGGYETEWEFHFSWDRHATFLNAQSRAMSELRALIKQFNELANDDDERRLKLEQMQLNIDKTKAEVNKISSKKDDGPIEILIKRKGEGL